ncbi:hypothetical protein AAE026_35295 [Bradyrhizobium sp. DN5]|uniref:hypothetical protein n=1 Tax=Bradyrhizobium sp. DN5 TaxID=3056950 RepID=UPI003523C6CE
MLFDQGHEQTRRKAAARSFVLFDRLVISTASLAFPGLYVTGRRDLQLLDQQQPALLIAIVRIHSCEQPLSLD